jgi:sulfate adenylyltransferase
MGRADYESVVSRMRLTDGTLWPIPIVLDIPEVFADRVEIVSGSRCAIGRRAPGNHGVDEMGSRSTPGGGLVFGTSDPSHLAYGIHFRTRMRSTSEISTRSFATHYDFRS